MEGFVLVLSVLSVGHSVLATQRDTTTDHVVLQQLQHLKGHLTKLEQRLEDQNNKILNQQMTIQDLNDRIMKQDVTIQDLNGRLLKQERTTQQQKHQLDQQEQESLYPFTKQNKTTQNRKYSVMKTWRRPSVENKSFKTDPREERMPPLLGDQYNQVNLSQTHARKRSDDAGALEVVLNHVTQQITEMTSDIQALKIANTQQDQARGTSYTRWGHAGCPGSAELVFTGIIGGSHYTSTGGAANHLCLTSHPVFDGHRQPSENGFATVYGSEYNICPEPGCNTTPACAACRVSRSASVMIPGTNACSPGWTKEYSGYIMAGFPGYSGSSEFICVDSSHGSYVHTSQSNDHENIIYYTHTRCGALPCPPYANDKVVTCVVCTK